MGESSRSMSNKDHKVIQTDFEQSCVADENIDGVDGNNGDWIEQAWLDPNWLNKNWLNPVDMDEEFKAWYARVSQQEKEQKRISKEDQ